MGWHDDYASEGEALSDILEGCDDDDWLGTKSKEEARAALYSFSRAAAIRKVGEDARSWRKAVYDATKAAKVGTDVCCAGCGKQFKKKTYQHTFCRNKGQNNCKDKYWNCATDERWRRTVSILLK